jgi:acyl-CoA synthetase (AMP-forming)/AMP-acid ligase II
MLITEILARNVANALLAKGIKKGDKVIHLMMNCIEWLPAYFGVLRTGAWVVPLNFRFSADDIKYCSEIAEAKAFIFGEEFIDRVNPIKESLDKTVTDYIFVGPEDLRPEYAQPYTDVLASASADATQVEFNLIDSAALYFTSGTTGTQPGTCLLR